MISKTSWLSNNYCHILRVQSVDGTGIIFMALELLWMALHVVSLLILCSSVDANISLVIFLRENVFTPFALNSLRKVLLKLLFGLSVRSKWKLNCIYSLKESALFKKNVSTQAENNTLKVSVMPHICSVGSGFLDKNM